MDRKLEFLTNQSSGGTLTCGVHCTLTIVGAGPLQHNGNAPTTLSTRLRVLTIHTPTCARLLSTTSTCTINRPQVPPPSFSSSSSSGGVTSHITASLLPPRRGRGRGTACTGGDTSPRSGIPASSTTSGRKEHHSCKTTPARGAGSLTISATEADPPSESADKRPSSGSSGRIAVWRHVAPPDWPPSASAARHRLRTPSPTPLGSSSSRVNSSTVPSNSPHGRLPLPLLRLLSAVPPLPSLLRCCGA
eukprot:691389-Prorocentrum_minimum.AAC.2